MTDAAAVATLDALIDQLLAAGDDTAFASLVSTNVMSFDVKFFLRVAARSDAADDGAKPRLAALASRVMSLMDGIVKQTRRQMSGSQDVLTKLVGAAADDGTGAFNLPLRPDRVARIRAVMASSVVDEAVLSNAYAWMRKASDDGLDGMVVIVQRVLQLWAGRELAKPGASPSPDPTAEALLQQLLAAPEEEWAPLLAAAKAAGVSDMGFTRVLQQRMEAVVLGVANGSYAQRVQAEFLKEIEARAKAAFAAP
jgi:hypothetical protein